MEIFPNPSHGNTCIPVATLSSVKADVSLYDIFGRKIQTIFNGMLKKGDNKFFLNSVGITPGVYLVTLISDGQHKTGKLVIR
ncbi:MAG: T9SS type A sorting domain-containing protein [Bacteroidia bacterium]|nr:T9SS type A sorting domain-containing protein [Bacteroidia bacterium]